MSKKFLRMLAILCALFFITAFNLIEFIREDPQYFGSKTLFGCSVLIINGLYIFFIPKIFKAINDFAIGLLAIFVTLAGSFVLLGYLLKYYLYIDKTPTILSSMIFAIIVTAFALTINGPSPTEANKT